VMRFRMSSMNKPGLRVTLQATPPAGLRVLEVEQPSNLKATDSSGADISQIEEGFGGKREYLKLEGFGSPFDDDKMNEPQEIVLSLGESARKADKFSATGTGKALIGGKPRSVTIEPAKEWTKLDIPEFAGIDSRYRVKSGDGETSIEFKSDAVEPRIHEMIVVRGEQRNEANGWSSMNGVLQYTINAALDKGAKIEMQVFTDVREVAIKIELKDVALP
jgi:hypothetical protein